MAKQRVSPGRPEPEPARAPMRPVVAIGITVLVIAIVVGAGIGIDWATGPRPSTGFSGCKTATELAPGRYAAPPANCIDPNATYDGIIHTTKGDITFVFLTKQAPKTTNNFIVLAENGYFNGQTFWRADDWIVQSGDPSGNGQGGPGYSLPVEPVAVDEQWVPGSLGMARFPDGSISGSQFFILKSAWPGGNPDISFNHFGTVTLGFDIVSQLTTSDRILSVEIKRG